MAADKGVTTIPLTKPTRDRLRGLGKKGESYDQLLNRLMDVYVNRTVEFEPVTEGAETGKRRR